MLVCSDDPRSPRKSNELSSINEEEKDSEQANDLEDAV